MRPFALCLKGQTELRRGGGVAESNPKTCLSPTYAPKKNQQLAQRKPMFECLTHEESSKNSVRKITLPGLQTTHEAIQDKMTASNNLFGKQVATIPS